MFYLFAYVNLMPDGYAPVSITPLKKKTPTQPQPQFRKLIYVSQWQAAYDKLAEYVWENEPTTQTYYFGIPYDNEHDFDSTPLMFAFEVYNDRKVRR